MMCCAVVLLCWRVQVLLEAGIKTADAVVLGSGSAAGGDLESDARVLAAILQVGMRDGGGSCDCCWAAVHCRLLSSSSGFQLLLYCCICQ